MMFLWLTLSVDSAIVSIALALRDIPTRQLRTVCLAFGVCDAIASTLGLTLGPARVPAIAALEVPFLAVYVVGVSVAVFRPSALSRPGSWWIIWSLAGAMSLDNLLGARAMANGTMSAAMTILGPGLASGVMAFAGYGFGLASRRYVHERLAPMAALGIFAVRLMLR
jgi:putative Mn2+ efflux pump MntP